MIPGDSRHPSDPIAGDDEGSLAVREFTNAAESINVRQWIEAEATAKLRAEREARRRSEGDRNALYERGPTAFSA